jgi:hypothetical protein
MTRALRRHCSDHDARRAQRTHRCQVHHDGTLDCICEQRVWYFEKR